MRIPRKKQDSHIAGERETPRIGQDLPPERLRRLLDAGPAVLFFMEISHEHGLVLTWISDNIQRLLGDTVVEALRQDWRHKRLHPDDLHRMAAGTALFLDQGFLAREFRMLHKNGGYRWIREELRLLPGDGGRPDEAVGAWYDITDLYAQEEKLQHLTHYDLLTDLPNRRMFLAMLGKATAQAQRHSWRTALFLIHLGALKKINKTLGHPMGDRLLLLAGKRLQERVRESDTMARFSGDTFALLPTPPMPHTDAAVLARDLLQAMTAPILLDDGLEVEAEATIGVAIIPDDAATGADAIRCATSALGHPMEDGPGRYSFYSREMDKEARERLEMESALRRGLSQQELVLYYQPKVDLRSGRICGAEALVRWLRQDGTLVPPASFIPLAEENGFILEIGAWVIDEACRQISAWIKAGLPATRVAVNVSARQFLAGTLVDGVERALIAHGVAPDRLELELTESMVMRQPDAAADILARLRQIGVRTSLDDFGTGHSSLAYLGRFAIDRLKIDYSFISSIVTSPESATITAAIIDLAHRMRLSALAEGVENEAQLALLRRLGCDEMQGFLFSPPVPADAFARLLGDGAVLPVPQENAAARRSILVVDDEPFILSAMKRLLADEGYQVYTAGDADQGFELLARHRVQVILSDQRMPGRTGTDFLGQVKKMYPDIVRLIFTGYADFDVVVEAVNNGAVYKVLLKPWQDKQLLDHLRDAFLYHEAVAGGQAPAPEFTI